MKRDPDYIPYAEPMVKWDVSPKRLRVTGTIHVRGNSFMWTKDCNNTPIAIDDAKAEIRRRAYRQYEEEAIRQRREAR